MNSIYGSCFLRGWVCLWGYYLWRMSPFSFLNFRNSSAAPFAKLHLRCFPLFYSWLLLISGRSVHIRYVVRLYASIIRPSYRIWLNCYKFSKVRYCPAYYLSYVKNISFYICYKALRRHTVFTVLILCIRSVFVVSLHCTFSLAGIRFSRNGFTRLQAFTPLWL